MLRSAAKLGLAATIVGATIAVSVPAPVLAQGSCAQLWYERNQIYASNGYCFQTFRARSVFGAGCFPPYGRMSGGEQARVQEIQMLERRYGCSG